MAGRAPRTRGRAVDGAELGVVELERGGEIWLLDGEARGLSPRTLEARADLVRKLCWWLRQEEAERCGAGELRGFLAYIQRGHLAPGGRWGNPRCTTAVQPRTAATWYVNLQTLFAFLSAEGVVDESPMGGLRAPIARADQVQPFTPEQVDGLLAAAGSARHPRRDTAILTMLLDTGCRASELCALDVGDLDLTGRACRVLGKGGKTRKLCFGRELHKSLWGYLRERVQEGSAEPELPLFPSDAGTTCGDRLTRSGLLQLVERLGRAAGLRGVRCSPHTFRHTFAVEFLRGGGNTFALQEMLGHTSLTMVRRYVTLAEADIERQHRQFSPADRRKKRA